jgi:hypothetical protein
MAKASANPALHIFANDLANKVTGNSSAPPRSIRAADLDGNFKALTLIPNTNIPYTVNVGVDGTSVDIFPPSPGAGTYVLGIVNGSLTWLETTNC